nr:MAG TPA: hypothetical protein [Caudoviricetes sp.]
MLVAPAATLFIYVILAENFLFVKSKIFSFFIFKEG